MRRFWKTLAFIISLIAIALFGFWLQDQYITRHHIYKSQYKPLTNLQRMKVSHDKNTIFVLTLSGGAMRGVLTLSALNYLEKNTGKPISELFPVIGSTSTGAIISTMLSLHNKNGPIYSVNDIVKFYNQEGPYIFHRTAWHRITTLDGMIGTTFSNIYKQRVIQHFIRNAELSSTYGDLVITGYSLKTFQPNIYTTRDARKSATKNYKLSNLISAVTALPPAFKPVVLTNKSKTKTDIVADGGLYQREPSIITLREAIKDHPHASRFILVAMGTGNTNFKALTAQDINKNGIFNWFSRLILIFFNSQSQNIHQSLSFISKPNSTLTIGNRAINIKYFNIDIPAEKTTSSAFNASPNNIKKLKKDGMEMVRYNKTALDEIIKELKKEN